MAFSSRPASRASSSASWARCWARRSLARSSSITGWRIESRGDWRSSIERTVSACSVRARSRWQQAARRERSARVGLGRRSGRPSADSAAACASATRPWPYRPAARHASTIAAARRRRAAASGGQHGVAQLELSLEFVGEHQRAEQQRPAQRLCRLGVQQRAVAPGQVDHEPDLRARSAAERVVHGGVRDGRALVRRRGARKVPEHLRPPLEHLALEVLDHGGGRDIGGAKPLRELLVGVAKLLEPRIEHRRGLAVAAVGVEMVALVECLLSPTAKPVAESSGLSRARRRWVRQRPLGPPGQGRQASSALRSARDASASARSRSSTARPGEPDVQALRAASRRASMASLSCSAAAFRT